MHLRSSRQVSWAALVDAHGPEAVDPDLCECTAEELAAYRLFCDGGIMDGFLAEERVKTPGVKSPFAVGQLVNHSESSNVEILQLDESLEETFAVGRLHQGLWYLDNQWRPVHVPSGRPVPIIALQAIQPVQPGEELFLNYRLRPPYPAWYAG